LGRGSGRALITPRQRRVTACGGRNEPNGTRKRGSGFDDESVRSSEHSPLVSCAAYRKKGMMRCSNRGHATELFDVLAVKSSGRSVFRTSDLQLAEISGKTSDPPNEPTRTLEPNVGIALYLVSRYGRSSDRARFFGLGFFLLTHSNYRHIGGLLRSPLDHPSAPRRRSGCRSRSPA
jgi:hypothetical protein